MDSFQDVQILTTFVFLDQNIQLYVLVPDLGLEHFAFPPMLDGEESDRWGAVLRPKS